MSLSPHASHLRTGTKMGDVKFVDTMIVDGLHRRLQRLSHGRHRRERRREVADHPRAAGRVRGASQNKAEAAQKAGKFKDEIVPVTIQARKGDVVVDDDEYIKHGATIEGAAKLRPPSTRTAP